MARITAAGPAFFLVYYIWRWICFHYTQPKSGICGQGKSFPFYEAYNNSATIAYPDNMPFGMWEEALSLTAPLRDTAQMK